MQMAISALEKTTNNLYVIVGLLVFSSLLGVRRKTHPCSMLILGSCDPDLMLAEASCETCTLLSRTWIGPRHPLSAVLNLMSGLKLMEISGFAGSETV